MGHLRVALCFSVKTSLCTKQFIWNQVIIKVRKRIPHIRTLTKEIPLKLFLDIAPGSSADITRSLRGCLRGGQFMFRLVSKQSKTSNAVSSLICWLQAKELRLSLCFNTFWKINGSLSKRPMYPLQAITTEWTRQRKVQINECNKKRKNTSWATEQTWWKVQADARCPNSKTQLKHNSNNARDNVD